MVELIDPMLNPFNITAEDEDSEFDGRAGEAVTTEDFEKQFDALDVALYNVVEDPEERRDLRAELPAVFAELRARALHHLVHVAPEDFPHQDFSGHPRNFGGIFSPGWCDPAST